MRFRTRKTRQELKDDFLGSTTLHGIADLADSENFCVCLIWSLAIFGAVGGAFYEIGMVIKDYVGSPLLTVYERKAEVRLPFPIIQICPSHFVNKTKAYVASPVHPSVVDEYLTYFASPAELTFDNYTAEIAGKDDFQRRLDKLPLAYLVVSSPDRETAKERIRDVLLRENLFQNLSHGSNLDEAYKIGYYQAVKRGEEAACMRASDIASSHKDCSQNLRTSRRKKRSVVPTGKHIYDTVKPMAMDPSFTLEDLASAAASAAIGGTVGASIVAEGLNETAAIWRGFSFGLIHTQVVPGFVDLAYGLVDEDDQPVLVSADAPIVSMAAALNLELYSSFISPSTPFPEVLGKFAEVGSIKGGEGARAVAEAAVRASKEIQATKDSVLTAAETELEKWKPTITPSSSTPTTTCATCANSTIETISYSASTVAAPTGKWDEYRDYPMPTALMHEQLTDSFPPYQPKSAAFVDQVGMDLGPSLVGCNWRAKYMDCKDIARRTFDAKLGQCFTFDSDFDRVQISEGQGLIVVVDLQKEVQWTKNPRIAGGVNVRIMESLDPVTLGDLWAPEGSVTKIDLRSTHYRFHEDPKYGACHRDVPRQILNANYSDGVCRAECRMREQLSTCGCIQITPIEFLLDPNVNQCQEYLDRSCLKHLMEDNDWAERVTECFAQCRPACSYWEHVASITYADFPSQIYEEYVRNSVPALADRLDNYLLLDISYARLQYTQIRQEVAISVDGFLSQIGGHLGLFLGSSVLSLCQLVLFTLNFCCCAKNRSKPTFPSSECARVSPAPSPHIDYRRPSLFHWQPRPTIH